MEAIVISHGRFSLMLKPSDVGFQLIRSTDNEIDRTDNYPGSPDEIWEMIGQEFGWFSGPDENRDGDDLKITWDNGSKKIMLRDMFPTGPQSTCAPVILFNSRDELWLFVGKRFGWHK